MRLALYNGRDADASDDFDRVISKFDAIERTTSEGNERLIASVRKAILNSARDAEDRTWLEDELGILEQAVRLSAMIGSPPIPRLATA